MRTGLNRFLGGTVGKIGGRGIRVWNILALVAVLAAAAGVGAGVKSRVVGGMVTETDLVPFASGSAGMQTRDTFTGALSVTVRGGGHITGGSYFDAFYLFADASGQLVGPSPIAGSSEAGLWISGSPATHFTKAPPAYDTSHTYTFSIVAPSGPLVFTAGGASLSAKSIQRDVFAVGQAPLPSATGAFIVTVTGAPANPLLDFTPSHVEDTSAQILTSGEIDKEKIAQIKNGLDCETTLIGELPGAKLVSIALSAALVHDVEDLRGFLIGQIPVVGDLNGLWHCFQTLRLGAIQAQALFLCLQRPDCTTLLMQELGLGSGATASPTPSPVWRVIPDTVPGDIHELTAVAALTPQDIWAVGRSYNNATNASETFIDHFNGSSWSQSPSPSPGSSLLTLWGVAAVTSSDVWAVGYYISNREQPLLEHWDGAAWRLVAITTPGSQDAWLNGISALSSSDIWSVGGMRTANGSEQALIEHWDGATWSQVPSPNPGSTYTNLQSVAALTPSDVWAVGVYSNAPVSFTVGHDNHLQTLIEHWDGSSWRQVASPSPGSLDNHLDGVVALSPTDAWVVGHYKDSNAHPNRTLILHWDGASWSQVPSPNPANSSVLSAIAAGSPTDIWADGFCSDSAACSSGLLVHWDGKSWTQRPGPQANGDCVLRGITALSTTDVIAVGFIQAGGAEKALIEQYSP